MASLLDLLGLGPNVAPWFPPAGSEVPPAAPPPPIAEAAPAIQEGPFERLMREAQQLPATDIYRQGVGLPPSAKVPSPDFNAPLPGLGPSWRDQFTPGLETAKGLIGGALEPFGQAGRLMTGASQDVPGDLAGVLAAATPMGRIGGLAKAGLKVADDGLKINIAPHNMEVPEWGKGLTWGLTAYRTKIKGEDAIHVRDARVPPDMRGQGLGTAMYEHAADLAAKEGKPLLSDGTVTQDAANRWMALNRAGYNVVTNPDKKFVPGPPEAPHLGRFETPDGSPVFRVEPKDKEAATTGGLGDAMREVGRGGPLAHPGWIDTRLPTGAKEIVLGGPGAPRIVDMEAMRATPAQYEKNIDLVRGYPNMPLAAADASHPAVERTFIDHAKGNLRWLYDQVPQDIRDRSKLWYDGGNKIVKDWSQQYGVSEPAAAAAIAALSPQRDWFQNVSLAQRVMQTMRGNGDNFYRGFTMSPEMEAAHTAIQNTVVDKKKGKPDWVPLFNDIRGKSLGDIDQMTSVPDEMKPTLKALWVRLHDAAHNEQSYPLINPEGTIGNTVMTDAGRPAKIQWGSLNEIGKAIQAIEHNGNPDVMQTLMGERHKVRNFYNNLLDPNGPHGDVTIDTHAVAAALLRPLAGADAEVAHNFKNSISAEDKARGITGAGGSANTGVNGTYPLYAEAYRQLAGELGLHPRELQSITWEAVRGLFPDTFKTPANKATVNSIWNDYRHGRMSIDEARHAIHDAAGGINPPDWH